MEPKFGKLTLDELKEVYKVCAKDPICCDKECPLHDFRKVEPCINVLQESVLELIDSYNAIRELYEYWNNKARELNDKADKYDSVRNELIRTQELLKNAQDECRKRADKIKTLRETIDAMDDDYNELDAKLKNEEMVRKSLEVDIKNITDQLDSKQQVIGQLLKEKAETHEELVHYHALKSYLQEIGKVMLDDQSGNHEKD